MKVTFLSDNLSKKVSFLNHAVSIRGQLPILSNLLLEAKNGKLYISATDLEIGIVTEISVNVEEEGKTTIPAKNFSDLLQNLENQKVTLLLEGNTLYLKGEKIKASFQTMPWEDFPRIYEEKGEELLSTNKNEIEKFLTRVVFSAAVSDSSRPALSGVLLDKDKNEVLLVATDGHRLSLQKSVFKTKEELKRPLVVPSRVIKELFLIKEDETNIKIYIAEANNQILFSIGETILVGRLIDDTYPEYEKIIPTDFSTKIEISKQDLEKAIKICSIFARETTNIVKFSVGKDNLTISANAPSVGEDAVEVSAKTTGEENEIAFNAKYLLDILAAIDKNDLVFEMTGPLNPGVFKIKEDNSFLHLIMPIRVQE